MTTYQQTKTRRWKYPQLRVGCVGAWYPGAGIQGTKLYDTSGYANHGTVTNATATNAWTLSNGQSAIKANATSDYVTMGTGVTKPISQGSLACWMYIPSPATSQQSFFGWGSASTTGFAIAVSGTNVYFLWAGTSTYGFRANANTGWVHYAYTFKAGTSSIWINGIPATLNVQGTPPSTLAAITGFFGIGYYAGLNNTVNVLTDEGFAWNRAITQGDVSILSLWRGIGHQVISPLSVRSVPSSALLLTRRKQVLA